MFADFIIFFAVGSLSHAKVGEDIVKYLLTTDLATCDFA